MNVATSSSEEVQDYYHRILPFFEEELRDRGDGDFWTEAASGSVAVLEPGAGTGRATAFLARTAGRVVAFDLSPEMAARARRRLADQPHVAVLVADMRELRLRERFDLIAAVDDPFVHLTGDDDRDRAFARISEHLAPGGRFVLDAAWFPPEDREAAASGLVRERSADGGELRVREVWCCDPDSRLCTARYEYRQDGRLVGEASFPGRLWSVEELEDRAARAGLTVSRLWGDYDRRSWDRETSPRLIAEMVASARPADGPDEVASRREDRG
jgi:SAM-dependent methyltransferase